MASSALPSAVKIPLPESFKGEMDYDRVTTFLFSFDSYCHVVGLSDDNAKAALCAMLLSGDARTWFMHNQYDQSTLTYTTLAADLRAYFRPADYEWKARE